MGLLILIPNRYVYIAFLFLFLIGYLCHGQFSMILDLIHDGLRWLDSRVKQLLAIDDYPIAGT
jgi:hypothetical protein